jgi:hypothetical protein
MAEPFVIRKKPSSAPIKIPHKRFSYLINEIKVSLQKRCISLVIINVSQNVVECFA